LQHLVKIQRSKAPPKGGTPNSELQHLLEIPRSAAVLSQPIGSTRIHAAKAHLRQGYSEQAVRAPNIGCSMFPGGGGCFLAG